MTMMSTLPIVYVIDDDISVRESLEMVIRSAGWQPELFQSASDFLSRPKALVPHCLILDVNLPGLSGLELQKLLSENRHEMPIIFITGFGNVPMAVRAIKAGADEFLTKPFSNAVLIDAIGAALEKSAAFAAMEAEMETLRERYGSLTNRERDVLRPVVAGKLNKQVAFELGISEITVKAHRAQMMRKMNARSLPDLVTMVAKLTEDGFL
jgi:FixJ family two-component response regulator